MRTSVQMSKSHLRRSHIARLLCCGSCEHTNCSHHRKSQVKSPTDRHGVSTAAWTHNLLTSGERNEKDGNNDCLRSASSHAEELGVSSLVSFYSDVT